MSTRGKDPAWAWIALIGIAYAQAMLNGVIRAFGIIYVELLDVYDAGPLVTGWVPSVFGFTLIFASPLAAVINTWLSTRWMVICCSIGGTVSLIGCSLAPNIYVIMFTYGLLFSFFEAITFNAVMVSCNRYFEHRRALANGIALAGASAGGMSMPFLLQILINKYSVRGTFMIMSGLWLNLCIVGALFRPFSEIKSSEGQMDNFQESVDYGSGIINTSKCSESTKEKTSNTFIFKKMCMKQSSKVWNSPFCSLKYITLVGFWFFMVLGIFSIILTVPPYVEELHFSKAQTASLLTIVGATDLVTRFTLGGLGDLKFVNKSLLVSAILLCFSIASVFVPLMTQFWHLALYSCLLGIGTSTGVYLGPFVVEAVGIENVSFGISFISVAFGTANTVGPLTVGVLKESTGTYQHQFLLAAVSMLVAVFILSVLGRRLPALNCKPKLKQRTRKNSTGAGGNTDVELT